MPLPAAPEYPRGHGHLLITLTLTLVSLVALAVVLLTGRQLPPVPAVSVRCRLPPATGNTDGGIARDPGSAEPEGGAYGYAENKADYLKRLRRIEGQVRGPAADD